MTRNTSGNPVFPECDLADLYRVDDKPAGGFRLVRVRVRPPVLQLRRAGRICNLIAAANAYVSRELLLYSLPHDDQDGFDPDYVRMAEFRHRDVSTEDSPLRLPAADAGGPYQVDEGGSVQLSGSGGRLADRPGPGSSSTTTTTSSTAASSSTSTTAGCSSSRTSTPTASTTRRAPCGGAHRPGSTSSSTSTTTSEETSASCTERGRPRRSRTSTTSASATRHPRCAGSEPSRLRARAASPGTSTTTEPSTTRVPRRRRSARRRRTASSPCASGSRMRRGPASSTTVTVRNVPPSVTIAAPVAGSVHELGVPVTVSASFNYPVSPTSTRARSIGATVRPPPERLPRRAARGRARAPARTRAAAA